MSLLRLREAQVLSHNRNVRGFARSSYLFSGFGRFLLLFVRLGSCIVVLHGAEFNLIITLTRGNF